MVDGNELRQSHKLGPAILAEATASWSGFLSYLLSSMEGNSGIGVRHLILTHTHTPVWVVVKIMVLF